MDNPGFSRTQSVRGTIPSLLGLRTRANSADTQSVKGNLEIMPSAPADPLPPLPDVPFTLRSQTTRTPAPRSPTSRFFTAHENASLSLIPESRFPTSLDAPHHNDVRARSHPPSPTKPNKNILPTLASLTPPPDVNFNATRIAWKGLPLEAALWTFSSTELQEIVRRAIRLSARESFIRLLPIEALDHSLVVESERLKTLKKEAQTKFQFQVQRRTTLLQALNSHNIFAMPTETQKDAFITIVSSLTSQVSEAAAECDRLTQELLHIADQQAQIAKAKDLHWASALAIALRKLNTSYGRRTTELQMAQGRVDELEGELEEAWREAERIARELDEMNADVDAMSIGGASVLTATGEIMTEFAEIVGTSAASKRALTDAGGTTASGFSGLSSRKHDQDGSWRRVEAAKKRSNRVTNASLRPSRTRNTRRPLTAQLPHPTTPLPPIPTSADNTPGDSYLDLESLGASSSLRRTSSLDGGRVSSLGHKRVASDGTSKRQQDALTTEIDRSSVPPSWMNTDLPKTPQPPSEDEQTIRPTPYDISRRTASEFSKLKLRIKRFSAPFGRPSTTSSTPVSRSSS